jgi:F0F1-type ATP synthase assembly protein I
MKPHQFKIRGSKHGTSGAATDDNAGRGMDLALTIALFLAVGWLLDSWLGTSPLFKIVLLVIAAVGSFTRMKYSYEASMERLEADRRQRTQRTPSSTIEDVA